MNEMEEHIEKVTKQSSDHCEDLDKCYFEIARNQLIALFYLLDQRFKT